MNTQQSSTSFSRLLLCLLTQIGCAQIAHADAPTSIPTTEKTAAPSDTTPTPLPSPTPSHMAPVRKPAIYLYSPTPLSVRVEVTKGSNPEFVYPAFEPQTSSWTVTTQPDGTLVDSNGRKLRYLFWEGTLDSPPDFDPTEGAIVRGADTREFLDTKLQELGLSDVERNDFVVYWYPLLGRYPWVYINFITKKYDQAFPLAVKPTPDAALRIYMAYRSVEGPAPLKEQRFAPFFRAAASIPTGQAMHTGLSLVEWGGGELPAAPN